MFIYPVVCAAHNDLPERPGSDEYDEEHRQDGQHPPTS